MTFEEVFHTWALNLEEKVSNVSFKGNKVQVSVIQKNKGKVLRTTIECVNKKDDLFFRVESTNDGKAATLIVTVNTEKMSLSMLKELISGIASKEVIDSEDIEKHTEALWGYVQNMDGESLSYLNKGFFF